MLVKHFCFEDNRAEIFEKLSARLFFFLQHAYKEHLLCVPLWVFLAHCVLNCPCQYCQYFVVLSVNDSSMESLVTVSWLNNCKIFFFPLHTKSWQIRKGNGKQVYELLLQCSYWIVLGSLLWQLPTTQSLIILNCLISKY